ncbi:aminotransferase [Pyrobaculum islandicum DSM 4184]|uniref:histidinol-phosphate transaminase n=1 Tax=Pyrobaculum islandicum (strain DSM 4184 / JCM 9189 / GEO3) TaxID=384616 RepID=A1RU99_PYRIL|nr:aminotransferase class I/II-fold pyridoxal phosphate-dependent enzyme [Pyrobaculum islandicum]ABL88531.1 aminotransferase [Pyrobaculum islandicum DSM 4184]
MFRLDVHGGSTWAEEVRYDFSDNSNPIGPPPGLEEALVQAAARGVHRRFPAHLAEEVLREYEGVEVTLFNGATEALLYALLDLRPRRLLVAWPSYGDYERIARLLGVPAVRVPPPLLEREARPGDVAILCNPNNPTGFYMPRDAVLDLAGRLRRRGAFLLVDESFMEFAGGKSAAPDLPVVKSYGKFLATPGLRIGALLYKHRDPPPWRINSIADYAIYHTGAEFLRAHREKTVAYVREEGARVQAAISRCVKTLPTSVHFQVVFGPPPPGVKVRPLWDKGIAGFRYSLRRPPENDVLIEAVCGVSRR